MTGAVDAQSLRDALATAYSANPELGAERARLRATDEGVPQALSGMRPTVTATGDYGSRRDETLTQINVPRLNTRVAKSENFRAPRGYTLSFSQPLFDGFRTITRTAQADANVLAGRGLLDNVEQNILLTAATAYVDVRRDLALVRLTQGNLRVLREELESTRARFNVGELTKTDVAQAEARVSGAISEVSQAKANLATSRATFEQVVRRPAGNLRQPASIDAHLPKSLKQAYVIAEQEHPALRSARFSIEASDHEIEAIRGEFLPTVTLEGDYTERWETSETTLRNESATILGRVTVPLYQAGSVSSRVRQARQTATQRRMEAEDIRAEVNSAVASAFDGLVAARAQIVADREQVRAASVALEGVRQEQRVGQRTTLDVLDQQQELLNAQVNLETSVRNEVVAAYTLLASIGRLNVGQLNLPVARYDPTEHYNRVRNQWIGTGVGTLN